MTLPPPAQQRLPAIERIIPPHAPGMRIGLFGGTFDPPHRAHFDACLLAMKRLQLDRIWWLVTPGNPLKNTSRLAPLAERMEAARRLAHHPRIDVTGIEAVINTRYTFDTIEWLIARCPRVQFVWIMGADNLRHFHRWQKWRGIAELIPIAVVDRPGPSLYASNSTAGQALSRFRIPEGIASSLPGRKPPVWVFLHGLKSTLSSTALRALRDTPRTAAEPAKKKEAAPDSAAKTAPKTSTRKSAGKKKSRTQAKTVTNRTVTKKKSTAKKNTAAKTGSTRRAKVRKMAGKTTRKTTGANKRGKPSASRRKTSRKRAR